MIGVTIDSKGSGGAGVVQNFNDVLAVKNDTELQAIFRNEEGDYNETDHLGMFFKNKSNEIIAFLYKTGLKTIYPNLNPSMIFEDGTMNFLNEDGLSEVRSFLNYSNIGINNINQSKKLYLDILGLIFLDYKHNLKTTIGFEEPLVGDGIFKIPNLNGVEEIAATREWVIANFTPIINL